MTYLTTTDNPWNPFDNWNEWLRYDIKQGYNTCERIDRLSPTSDTLPENINLEILEEAMDFLIKNGAISKDGTFVNYKKVHKTPKEGLNSTTQT